MSSRKSNKKTPAPAPASNPYHFPPSFMSLMASQQGSNSPATPSANSPTQIESQPVHLSPPSISQPFPFTSYPFTSQAVHFSSPSIPQPFMFSSSPVSSQSVPPTHTSVPQPGLFTSQPEESVELGVDDITDEGGSSRRDRWTQQEDLWLIAAWLNTSKDPIVGVDQNVDRFWSRVSAIFRANEGASQLRNELKCRGRWQKINHPVCKFVGCFSRATGRKKSGESDADVLNVAHEFYKADNGDKRFTLIHCWNVLKNEQKWLVANKLDENSISNKRNKQNGDGTYSSSCNNDESESRPQGVKAAKRKGKAPVVSNNVEDKSMDKIDKIAAIKEKEMEGKDRNGKVRLLESLIVNRGSLSPSEVMLKDKLIEHLMNNI